MGFLGNIFGKSDKKEHKIGGMEDYMTLVRVYLQAAIAENAGITNLAMLPDLEDVQDNPACADVEQQTWCRGEKALPEDADRFV